MRTLVLSLFLAAAASADTTLWDEALNGDLNNVDPTLTPLTLVAGVNHVLGSVERGELGWVDPPVDLFDTWQWNLPGSLHVISIEITLSGFSGLVGRAHFSSVTSFNPSQSLSLNGNGVFLPSSSFLSLYQLISADQDGLPGLSNVIDLLSASFSYDFAVTTRSLTQPSGPDPVPEPATLALLGSGLAFALAARRRKRSA